MKSQLTTCKACGADMAKDAKICPKCGKQNPRHTVVYSICALIIVFTAAAVIFILFSPPGPVEKKPPEVEVSAVALYKAYTENAVNADSLYKDKTIRITGTISNIGRDIVSKKPCIMLESGSVYGISPVQCFFPDGGDTELIAALRDGQEVAIVGRCTGNSVAVIQLTDCYLEETE